MLRLAIVASLVAGCAGDPTSSDVTGPFTGTPGRYVVDGFTLPRNYAEARAIGGDLDGNGYVDNQLSQLVHTLASFDNLTSHGADMIASGVIASSMVIRADDLADDPTVSVIYYGSDGAAATHVGGTFEAGHFVSNRTATTLVPGAAIVRLPVFVDADPSDVPLEAMQIELAPDGDGYIAALHGGVRPDDAFVRAYAGATQLIAAAPDSHRTMQALFDTNKDWTITYEEFRANSLLSSLLAPDVRLFGRELVSFGFQVHLRPCESGTCIDAPPASTCHDRVRDGDESDVDCGGSCRSCKADERCNGPADCESTACDAGFCRAPTCSDGLRDGFETDVDCGGPCSGCELGARCWGNADCGSGQCGEPCLNPDPFGCLDLSPDFDVCREPAPT